MLAAYRFGDLAVAEICVAFDVSRGTLYRLLARVGEPFRRAASAEPGRALERVSPIDLAVPGEEGSAPMERRLERLLSARIAELEVRALPGRSADPEAAAKALALHVRTLATLRRTVAASGDDHDSKDAPDADPPRSLVALRDELYAHLQRISEEGQDDGGAGRPAAEADGDGGMAPLLADLLPDEPAASA